MLCLRNPVRPCKYLVYTFSALFIAATVWPTVEMSYTFGSELQSADTVQAVLHGQVVEENKGDSLKPVAETHISGMVIDEKVAKTEDNQSDSLKMVKAKGSKVVKIAVAAGVIVGGVITYLLLSGKEKQGGRVPTDTTGRR